MPLPLINKKKLPVAFAYDVSAGRGGRAFGRAAARRGADLPEEAR